LLGQQAWHVVVPPAVVLPHAQSRKHWLAWQLPADVAGPQSLPEPVPGHDAQQYEIFRGPAGEARELGPVCGATVGAVPLSCAIRRSMFVSGGIPPANADVDATSHRAMAVCSMVLT
jgi:hypothetical protein